ncbi:MAG: helix-turn-helix domain-containing protein [Chloroflexota bacterium]|nr:helix-turn-helix domain-containing protein [Chloroflexota bacterium]
MSDKVSPMRTYTAAEVAKILKMDVDTIRKKMAKGQIPAIKIGGQWRIEEETLRKLLTGELRADEK